MTMHTHSAIMVYEVPKSREYQAFELVKSLLFKSEHIWNILGLYVAECIVCPRSKTPEVEFHILSITFTLNISNSCNTYVTIAG